jgi:hypothetical protein
MWKPWIARGGSKARASSQKGSVVTEGRHGCEPRFGANHSIVNTVTYR